MKDTEFDDLFKSKLEDIHAEFKGESWDLMSVRLAAFDVRKLRRRRSLQILAALMTVLLFSAGAFLWISTDPPAKPLVSLRYIVKPQTAEPLRVVVTRPAVPPPAVTALRTVTAPQAAMSSRWVTAPLPSDKLKRINKFRAAAEYHPVAESLMAVSPGPALSTLPVVALTPVAPASGLISFLPVPQLLHPLGRLERRLEKRQHVSDKADWHNTWLISLSAAPENNAPSFSPLKGQTGLSLDAAAGLKFSRRLTAWAGLGYSVKLYKNYPLNISGQYTGQGFTGSVDANCKVLEVPLGLTYAIHTGQRADFYAGAGMVSYFMLKENYNFYAAGSGDSPVSRETIRNHNRNILGVVQLMAGYQLKFSNSLALGVQPFIKIPFSGIGEHKYKDISTGAALVLNFSINNRN